MHTCTCDPAIALIYGCTCRPVGPTPTTPTPTDSSWTRSPLARWAWAGDGADLNR